MKKRFLILFMVIVAAISLFSCTSNVVYNATDLVGLLPSNVKTVGYVSYENIMSIEIFKELAEEGNDANIIDEIMTPFGEVIIGVGEFDTVVGNVDDMVMLMSGEYLKEDIKTKVAEALDVEELEVKDFDGVEGVTVQGNSMLFISETLIALTTPGYETKVISATNGKDTLDNKSDLYQRCMEMTSNMSWIVSDLEHLGEQDFSGLGVGITQKASFNISTLGISEAEGLITMDISIGMDNSEVVETLADTLNMLIPSLYSMLVRSYVKQYITDQELIDEIQTMVDDLKFKAEELSLTTKIEIKLSTIEQLIEILKDLGFI